MMLPIGTYNPEELEMLCKVLDDHCAERGIERASREHEEASTLILSLYEKGMHTADELKAALGLTDNGEHSMGLADYSLGSWNNATPASSRIPK
jgi:hypothetical protein